MDALSWYGTPFICQPCTLQNFVFSFLRQKCFTILTFDTLYLNLFFLLLPSLVVVHFSSLSFSVHGFTSQLLSLFLQWSRLQCQVQEPYEISKSQTLWEKYYSIRNEWWINIFTSFILPDISCWSVNLDGQSHIGLKPIDAYLTGLSQTSYLCRRRNLLMWYSMGILVLVSCIGWKAFSLLLCHLRIFR